MAHVLKFFDSSARQFTKKLGREEAQARAAFLSRVCYVGNLAFVTTDVQLHALFNRCGVIERVIMGLNRVTKQPCGFAFVIFVTRASTVAAVTLLHGSTLDERQIKVEMDKGWYPGREFGRGETGAQVRDELRTGYDEGRGGYSVREQQQASGAAGGGVGAEEVPAAAAAGGGGAADWGSRDARARRFSGGPGGGGIGYGGGRPRDSWGSGGRPSPQAPFASPQPPRPSYGGGGGWNDRGSGGGDDGGAGSKRRRGPRDDDDGERDGSGGGGGGGRHRPFHGSYGGGYDGGAGGARQDAAVPTSADGEGGRRRRRGGGGGGDGEEEAEGGGMLPEVDEFGREVRRD